jgi:gliding motility-associated-like protein
MKIKNYLSIIILFTIRYVFDSFTKNEKKMILSLTPAEVRIKKYGLLKTIFILSVMACNMSTHAQNFEPFTIRYNKEIKGNMLLIGNNILGKDNNPLDDNSVNQNISMKYIDIDTDAATFSSSSANLVLPSTTNCFKIVYAGLYWGAILKVPANRTNISKVKLKLPGNTSYTDITGTTIYDAVVNPIPAETNEPPNTPYASYADVTSLVSSLTNPQGTYTVANVTSSEGFNSSTGLSAGWTLFVVYEDAKATSKSITSFDGFSSIYDDKTLNIPISGFRTPPAGVINILYAFASLEGDKGEIGSKTEINGKAIVNAPQRASNKFFNSAITNVNGYFTNRVPSNSNTLGYDTGIESILNAEKSVISYNATSAVITVQVAKGQANPVFSFFNAFAVDVIAPDIELTKIVKDISGNNVGNTDVVLGQDLYYEINFQNLGNDNVTNFILKDVLPKNVVFNYPSDIILPLPIGVTHTYNATTRTILFTIPDNLVEIGDVMGTIRLHVQVVNNYNDLSDACSNEIKNQAYATYRGKVDTALITEEPSYNTSICNFGTPQSTNFLVNIDGLIFTRQEVLCGNTVLLTASNGYDSYSWSTSSTGLPVVGTGQTFTATNTGAYYVTSVSNSTCKTIKEQITVFPFGNTITNPVIPYADEVVICQNNGKELPNIFLCGANATRLIQTNISNASTILWEKLDESSCPATIANCANENSLCQWNSVGTSANFLVTTAGQFRVTLRYQGGCFSRFYFNVYQNLLLPTAVSNDIICTTNGKITIGGVPSGYEYSLNVGGPYQPSNIFTITTAGSYTVYIKQVGVVTNPCIFSVPNILIRKRNFIGSTIVTQPLCKGDKGSIKIAASDADPQYYYSISQGTTLINSVGPVTASDYEFAGLNPGIYTVRVWTTDGCDYSATIEIIEPAVLTATSALTKSLTCVDGEITVYPVGGTAPYKYYVNGATTPQNSPQIVVTNPLPAGGTYTIEVEDSRGCKGITSITVAAIPPPVYTFSQTDIKCFNSATGAINFNVTNANGYTLTYSINNGATYVTTATFSNLIAGTYTAILKYSLAGTDCFSTPQIITITQPTAITATATVTIPYTCSGTATIEAQGVSGGTPGYTYSINGTTFQAGTTFVGLTNGTYSITVKDTNGCTFVTNTVVISALNSPTDLAFSASALTCPTNKSNVTITTTGTNTPYSYTILPSLPAGATVTATGINNLSPGTYTFLVKDAKNCTYQEDFTISPLPSLAVIGVLVNNVQCLGTSTGAANFTVSGTANYSYTINGGTPVTAQTAPIINLSNRAAGPYAIVITDSSTNCTATASVTIAAPTVALAVTTTVTPIKCNSNGQLTVNATGGWGSFSYTLTQPDATTVGPQSSNIFANLAQPGSYTIRVTDANNCIVSNTFTLTTNTLPTASLAVTSDFCYDGTNAASLVVTASGGVAPYEYSNNNGAWQSSNTFANLTPGSYTIAIRDAYGCVTTLPAQTIANQLTLNAVLTKDLDCTSSPNAVITGTITGGYTPFTYQVKFNGGSYGTTAPLTGSVFTYPTAAVGTYQFLVTDAKGCTAESSVITINPLVIPTATYNSVHPTCNGNTDGSIKLIGAGGITPYAYSINGGISFQTTNVYGSLAGGLYNYIVRDSKGCDATGTITLVNPAPIAVVIQINGILCNSVTLGSFDIKVSSGGTAPYVYRLYNNSFAQIATYTEISSAITPIHNFGGLSFGDYYITVVDAKGCEFKSTKLRIEPTPYLNLTGAIASASCTTGVSVALNVTGGNPNYTYSIFGQPATSSGSITATSYTFPGLDQNTRYVFEVIDTNGCPSYLEVLTPAISPIVIDPIVTKNVTCYNLNNGEVTFTVINYDAFVTHLYYEIRDNLTNVAIAPAKNGTALNLTGLPFTGVLTGLKPGNYSLYVKEMNGTSCSTVTFFQITQPIQAVNAAISNEVPANCNNGAQVTIAATGGTGPYQYAFVADNTSPIGFYTGNNLGTLNLPTLIWDIWVKDVNDCDFKIDHIITKDPPPVVAAVLNNQCTAVEGNFAIDVTVFTAGIAPYTFSIDGGAFQLQTAPFTISNLSSGVHSVEVKDFNGCGNKVNVPILAPLGLTPGITALPSCANNDGVITIAAAGGSGNYSYAISPNTGIIKTINVFSNVPAGTYTITVTDTTTNCIKDTSVTLSPATPVTFDAPTITNVSCFGGNNGTIRVNLPLANDNPIYSYTLTATSGVPLTVGPQPSNIFPNLIARSYNITVTSGRNCTATQNVVVTAPTAALSVIATATAFTCALNNSVNTATVTIAATGGTPTYLYSIDGTNYFTSEFFTVVDTGAIQTITVYVKDANGCLATGLVSVTPLPKLTTATIAINAAIDCNNTGSVSISVTGGSGNFTYQLLPSGVPQAANSFSLTAPGTYYFQVNDATTGCYIATLPYVVAPFNTIDVVATAITPVTCFGDSNGAIAINVTGYTGTYNYEVFNSVGASIGGVISTNTSVNPRPIAGLAAGNYTVKVTETASPFCIKTSNMVTVSSPSASLVMTANETSNVTCTNDKGTITAIATGGWGSYQYELSGAQNVAYTPNGTFTNLAAGTYTIKAKDLNGCIFSRTVALTSPAPINATATPNTTVLSCFGDKNGIITISAVTGGQGSNYSYTLNVILPTASSSGPQLSPIFSGLGAGTYNVTVKDGYNCSFTSANIVVVQPTVVQASLAVVSTQTCLTQTRLTLTANGGKAPYTYSANNVTYNPTPFATSVTFPVAVGTYSYYVKDANGCIASVSNEIKIDPLSPLVINLDLTNSVINCKGDNSGDIVAKAQGGLGNYIFTLLNGAGNPVSPAAIQTSPGSFTGLFAGDYRVKVTSGDCATTSAIITITEPTAVLSAPFVIKNVSCNNAKNGSITINASGGTGIIQYAISPNLNQSNNTNIFNNLAPGNYDVIVQDQLGCYIKINFGITEPPVLAVSTVPLSIIPEICAGDKDGAFSISISGGTAPYRVSLDNPNGTYTTGSLSQTEFNFIGLSGGNHVVYIRDATDCTTDWSVPLPQSINMSPIAIIKYDCVNNAPVNSVTIKVDASITNPTDVDYSLDGGTYQVSAIFTNVAAGTHFVTARHTNGCEQKTLPFDIKRVNPLALVLNDGGLNEIVATATGGAGNYQYTLNGKSYGTTSNFIIYESGDYTVTVTDANGCVASATRSFSYIDVCISNHFTPNGDGIEDGWAPGCTINYKDLTFDIFDRYGRKIASYRLGQYWDGKYNGSELPTGDYWYVIKLNDLRDPREFVGHFTLYR